MECRKIGTKFSLKNEFTEEILKASPKTKEYSVLWDKRNRLKRELGEVESEIEKIYNELAGENDE